MRLFCDFYPNVFSVGIWLTWGEDWALMLNLGPWHFGIAKDVE